MSAICGIIALNSKEDLNDSGNKMVKFLNKYKFDRSQTFCGGEIFMWCGLRCVTPESMHEVLPKRDANRKLVITADAIIDNRRELLDKFQVKKELWDGITDSDLILMAYGMWRQDCPKYLIGDYAFAIWNEELKELFCARDHVGTRTIYYTYTEGAFSFCTTMNPLLKNRVRKAELNERWLTDFIALDDINHLIECEETVYQGIYEIAPASYLTFNSKGIEKAVFWDPFQDIKPLKLNTDREYEDAFNKVFFEAVHCRLRTIGEAGSFLSGGLDSTAIACVAAKKLSEGGKSLHTFTSIPLKGYHEEHPSHVACDESEEVEMVGSAYNNIETNFYDFEDKNALSDVEEAFEIFEQPYKIFRNLYWLKGLFEAAAKKNCRVILSGQYGNFTISAGNFATHIITLLKEHRFLALRREVIELSKLFRIPVLKTLFRLKTIFLPYSLRKAYYIIKGDYDPFKRVIINKDLIKKWNVKKRYAKLRKNEPIKRYYDLKGHFRSSFKPEAFSHIGNIMTQLSLAYGIISRDPSKDKRVIEFCLRLPSDQFVRNGRQRLLIRRAMAGIVPDAIRLNYSKRGVQGYDWLKRLEPQWGDICNEICDIMEDRDTIKYLDMNKVKKILDDLTESPGRKEDVKVHMILFTLIFSRFLKYFKGENDGAD